MRQVGCYGSAIVLYIKRVYPEITLMARQKSRVIDLSGRRREDKTQVLERLFSEHSEALRAFLRGVMGSSHELEDVVQEIFAKLAREEDLVARLPDDRAKWRSYLVAMANNLIVDMARYRQVRRKYLDREKYRLTEEDGVVNASPEAIALTRQQLEALKDVILGLKPRWRQAFILNRFNHKSYRQIADEMGVSVKQIEKYMKQALMRVRAAASEQNDRHMEEQR